MGIDPRSRAVLWSHSRTWEGEGRSPLPSKTARRAERCAAVPLVAAAPTPVRLVIMLSLPVSTGRSALANEPGDRRGHRFRTTPCCDSASLKWEPRSGNTAAGVRQKSSGSSSEDMRKTQNSGRQLTVGYRHTSGSQVGGTQPQRPQRRRSACCEGAVLRRNELALSKARLHLTDKRDYGKAVEPMHTRLDRWQIADAQLGWVGQRISTQHDDFGM